MEQYKIPWYLSAIYIGLIVFYSALRFFEGLQKGLKSKEDIQAEKWRTFRKRLDKITMLLIFWIGIFTIVVMGINPPTSQQKIDLTRLIINWIIVVLVAGGLIFTLFFLERNKDKVI